MPILKRLHVATTGVKQPMEGKAQSLTNSDIAELAQSYSPALHQCKVAVDDVQTAIQLGAPACLGHLDPSLVQAKGAMPAFGRVLSAEAGPEGLFLNLELTDKMADWIAEGLYDHVSVSWYDKNDSRNPTPGRKHLRHIGWLGAEPSGMKDLQLPSHRDIEFSEGLYEDGSVYHVGELTTYIEFAEMPTEETSATAAADTVQNEAQLTVEPEQESTVDPVLLLVSILQDGDKGYKGEVSGFEPAPTEENQFLWNEEAQEFAGKFMDDSGNEQEVYTFSLALQPDGSMTRSYRKVQPGDFAEAVPTDAAVEAEADAADEPTTAEFGEGCGSAEKLRNARLRPEMSECENTVQDMAAAGFATATAQSVTLSMSEYQLLTAKANDSAMYEMQIADMRRDAKQREIEEALMPMYQLGLIDSAVPCSSIANAILAMGEAASEDYCLEFAEGESHSDPLQTVLAVFGQIASRAKTQQDVEIEFGEMPVEEPEEEPPLQPQPAGAVANKAQATIDAKARAYCTQQGWDCKDIKQYVKAVKYVTANG